MVWSFDLSSNSWFMVVLHDWEKSPSGVLRGVSFTGGVCVCVVNRRQYDVAFLLTLILQVFSRIHLNLKV